VAEQLLDVEIFSPSWQELTRIVWPRTAEKIAQRGDFSAVHVYWFKELV
jgi:hypothetical protein